MRQGGVRPLLAALLAGASLLVACGTEPPPGPVARPVVSSARDQVPPRPRTTAPRPAPPQHLAAAPSAPAPTSAPSPTLQARISGLLAHPAFANASLGVSVIDDGGRPVFEHSVDSRLLPASALKLLPAAAALAVLGPDFRYQTALQATAASAPDGVLRGDLVLVGSGDPALATPLFGSQVYPERPRTPLEALADELVAKGVRHVTGGVFGDPSVFADEPVADGWLPRYFDELDAVRISGLTVDAGRKLMIRGSKVIGEPAPDPAAEAAASLYTLLLERGVTIDGGVTATRTPPTAPITIATVASPTLLELLVHTVQRSDNHMADQVFRTLGAAAGEPTWSGAAAATRSALSVLGLSWDGVVLADGSGLSRDDQLPAGFLTTLDLLMSRSTLAREWESLMARSGHSGTLRRRLRGTVAEGVLRGKTGSLRDVRSLAGAVEGPDGARYYLAVVGNDLDGPAKEAFRLVTDELVLALAEDLRGCVREPLPVTDPASPPPEGAYQLVCP